MLDVVPEMKITTPPPPNYQTQPLGFIDKECNLDIKFYFVVRELFSLEGLNRVGEVIEKHNGNK